MEKFKTIKYLKNKNGYALLFTVIIIGIIMSFASGISSSSLKQTILSSTANDSQIAFYQADTAGECALKVALDLQLVQLGQISCGVDSEGRNLNLRITQNKTDFFELNPSPTPAKNEPCFKITIDKTDSSKTIIKAYGYNVCDLNSTKKLERGIQIEF